MKILHIRGNQLKEASIELASGKDLDNLKSSKEFQFNWIQETRFTVYKIQLLHETKILGLISIQDIPKEYRLHIRLIENSNSNKGKLKMYDYVAGCLIAKVCEISFIKNYGGFVSLKPKSEILDWYITKYGFQKMGQLIYTDLKNSEALIQKYLENE